MEINHGSHEHPLVLSDESYDPCFDCGICKDSAMGLCYCCLECVFLLHKWCAELPLELSSHRLHPLHPLIRTTGKVDASCSACKWGIDDSPVFGCEQCSFSLHLECAALPQQLTFEFATADSSPVRIALHFRKHGAAISKCLVCGHSPFQSCFLSPDREHGLHMHCAMLPKTVKHERHIHELTLHVPIQKDLLYDECYCDACEKDRDPTKWVYYCANCEFTAHLSCGVLGLVRPNHGILITSPVYKIFKEENYFTSREETSIFDPTEEARKAKEKRKARMSGDEKLPNEKLQHFGHQHSLTLYDGQWNGAIKCDACSIFIYGKVYICDECQFYMHKWCAELPREKHFDIHSEHPLTLLTEHDLDCSYCEQHIHGFSFTCEECGFGFHTICALMPEIPKHESHKHPLSIAIYTPYRFGPSPRCRFPIRTGQKPTCNACQFPCEGMSLECEQCSFYVHLGCTFYPPTGKAETHRHRLVLNYSYQEDPNAEEFYCDACEKPRTPNCWVYCCPDPKCYIVAHLDCAVPKLFATPSLNTTSKEQEQE